MRVTSPVLFHWTHPNIVCLSNIFKGVMCDACDPWYALWFNLFMVTSNHSARKSTNNWNLETSWKVTPKIQDCARLRQVKRQKSLVDK